MTTTTKARPRLVECGKVSLTIFEPNDVGALLDERANDDGVAPYGAVLWPAGVAIATLLLERDLQHVRVVDVGAGSGITSLAAAVAGAAVTALDIDSISETLIALAAEHASVAIDWASFDVRSRALLPDGDLYVVADLLYEPTLAGAVARRAQEVAARGKSMIIGDPGRAGRASFTSLMKDAGHVPSFHDVTVRMDGGDISVGVWEFAP